VINRLATGWWNKCSGRWPAPLLRPHVRDLPVWGHFHKLYEGPGPALFAYSPAGIATAARLKPGCSHRVLEDRRRGLAAA